MPYDLGTTKAKIQFVAQARMPSLIYRACLATGITSNTAYISRAVCEALSRDLGIPLQELLDELPPTRSKASCLFGDDRRPIPRGRAGSALTEEKVR